MPSRWAGVALIGVPPSGAYSPKELLLQAAVETEQWWWAVVIQAGGIFTSAYLVLVLVHALAPADKPVALRVHVPCAFGKQRHCRSRCVRCCSGSFIGRPISRFRQGTSSSPLRPRGALERALADPGWRRAGDPAGTLERWAAAHTLAWTHRSNRQPGPTIGPYRR